MMNSKTTKKALLSSVVALFLCFTMLLGTTFAWFTDSVTNGVNKIVSGNLDVELYHSSYAASAADSLWGVGFGYSEAHGSAVAPDTKLFLDVDGNDILWEPGATAVENFRIKNEGSLALKYEFKLNVTNATKTPAGRDLSEIISLYIDEITYAENGVPQGTTITAGEALNSGYILEGELLPGETYDFWVGLEWEPSDEDNEFNVKEGLSLDLGITLLATQLTYEKDGYNGDQYDKDASMDDVVIKQNTMTENSGDAIVVDENESVALDMGDNTLNNTLVNNGQIVVTNGTIVTPETATAEAAVGFKNYGDATVTNVSMNTGSASDYGNILYAGSTTVYENVNIVSRGGGIGVTGGAKATFNSGSVYVDSPSTSARYVLYVVGAGSELTINGGSFSWDPTDNNKRAYIYAAEGTTVYVNGGEFGAASTRSGYTAGILGEGTVVITGGTFGFNPSAWVADGYTAVENNGTWTISAN